VSVIIPAYYSAATIRTCLDALREQTYRDFETIIVNSSPEDQTRQIVTEGFPEVVFEQSEGRLLPHAARNLGVVHARGNLIVFTDPDCVAMPDWLARLVATVDAGHTIVGGSMAARSRGWLERGIHLCKFFWALPRLPSGPHWIAPTANVCYTRQAWNLVGPFDGDLFAGDALICWRAAAQGHPPWFEPAAVVEHFHSASPASLWHERLVRGREFGRTRATFERWSRRQAGVRLAGAPVLLALVLVHAGCDSARSGWGMGFITTLPVQFLGQLAWIIGESQAFGKYLVRGTDGPCVSA
jgi:glycosyltransferase involved in cell wall biosynthesis